MTASDWKRVKAIAIQAWERAGEERAAFIASACGDDEDLRNEVLSLVASMADADEKFEIPASIPEPANDRIDVGVGSRVGAYEVLTRIGAGGMGEVYKARDTRLGRIVAIKFFAKSPDGDPRTGDRMSREARAVAALNHPHICTIHDIGSQDGLDFIVMEYLDGETLAARLAREALPVGEALAYAIQVASALADAHQAGIVHRDVKPANIMLHGNAPGAGRQAKLLDFGIAKARSTQPSSSLLTGSLPFGELELTAAGVVLGTAPYMAPEQIDGNAADARTDVFAFGAVCFEMLTGVKAFDGADRGSVIDAVRTRNVPRASMLRPGIPAALDRIVAKCLEKDPFRRYQTIDAVLADLHALERQLAARARRRIVPVAIAAGIFAIAAVAWTIWPIRDPQATSAPVIVRLAASAGVLGAPALSPDGTRIAFSWAGAGVGNPELVLLTVGSTTRTRLTNDAGIEEWPVWSPDGRELAFIRCRSESCAIIRMSVDQRTEQTIRELRRDRYYGLAWSPDGRSLVFGERSFTSEPYALYLLPLDGSPPRRLTSSSGSGDLRFAFSPDGRALAIVRVATGGIGVHRLALDTSRETPLIQGQQEWFGGIAWTPDGRNLILSANQQGIRRLWKLPATGGRLEQLAIAGEDSYYPAMSAHSDRLAFVRDLRDWDFARASLAKGTIQPSSPFSSSNRIDLDPAFSPDGRSLAFVSERSGTREIWISDADGSNARQMTSLNGATTGRPSWSPDGQQLAFHGGDLYVVPAKGGSVRRVFDDGEAPTWSADGRSLYFLRTKGGVFSIWRIAAEGGTPVQLIAGEVSAAREASGGRELYFLRSDGIWRRPLPDGRDERVIPDATWSLPGYWTIVRGGIYYVVRESRPDNTFLHHLKFFDFARGSTRKLGTLTGNIDHWVGGLTVSSDQRTVVYSQRTYESSEVVLIEHFR